jgi:hypothetical protein
MAHSASGYRIVPHTADLRIEAWAPTRNGCIRQAVLDGPKSDPQGFSSPRAVSRVDRKSNGENLIGLVALVECVDELARHMVDLPVCLQLDGRVLEAGDHHCGGKNARSLGFPPGVEFISQRAGGSVLGQQ